MNLTTRVRAETVLVNYTPEVGWLRWALVLNVRDEALSHPVSRHLS